MTTAALPARNWLMPLNAVLAVVCTVLFLLAIEQRQALAAWGAVQTAAASMVERTGEWVESGASGVTRLAAGGPAPTAPDPTDVVLSGAFAPEDPEVSPGGEVVFQHQEVRFAAGATLRTSPLRIMAAGDVRIEGRTLAERLNTVPDAQIEWRRIAAPAKDDADAVARLCAGAEPERLAILHRADRVNLLLFPAGPASLEEMPAPCGEWGLRAR